MSFYIRYISTDAKPVTLPILQKEMKELDSAYALTKSGELKHGKDVYAVIEINRPGDGLFEDELVELKEAIRKTRGKKRAHVLKLLDKSKIIVAAQILFADRSDQDTLAKVNPLFEWLLENRKGIAQVDNDGYYALPHGRILKVH